MPRNINKKIYLPIGLVLLLAGGLIYSAFFWQLGRIRNLSDDIQKTQLDSSVQQERRVKILELEKELGDIDDRKKEMDAMFVDRENAVPFLKMLESTAVSTGNTIIINITDLSKLKLASAKKSVGKSTDDESLDDVKKEPTAQKSKNTQSKKMDFSNQLGFSIELEGQFGSLIDFLTKLENMPYFVQVYSLEVIPGADKKSSVSGQGEVSQLPVQPDQSVQPEEPNKNIRTTLVIGVYTNDSK